MLLPAWSDLEVIPHCIYVYLVSTMLFNSHYLSIAGFLIVWTLLALLTSYSIGTSYSKGTNYHMVSVKKCGYGNASCSLTT